MSGRLMFVVIMMLALVMALFSIYVNAINDEPDFRDSIRHIPGKLLGNMTKEEMQQFRSTRILPDRINEMISNFTVNAVRN